MEGSNKGLGANQKETSPPSHSRNPRPTKHFLLPTGLPFAASTLFFPVFVPCFIPKLIFNILLKVRQTPEQYHKSPLRRVCWSWPSRRDFCSLSPFQSLPFEKKISPRDDNIIATRTRTLPQKRASCSHGHGVKVVNTPRTDATSNSSATVSIDL